MGWDSGDIVRAPYGRDAQAASPDMDDARRLALPDARAVGNILLLALAAAVYPMLLAIVLVVLTRPRPARIAETVAGGMGAYPVVKGVVAI